MNFFWSDNALIWIRPAKKADVAVIIWAALSSHLPVILLVICLEHDTESCDLWWPSRNPQKDPHRMRIYDLLHWRNMQIEVAIENKCKKQ